MASKKKEVVEPDQSPAPTSFDAYDLVKEINADAKDRIASVGSSPDEDDLRGYISTGCFVLDAYIGGGKIRGGFPIGRITEVFGKEGSGKTTLITMALIAAQKGAGTLITWKEGLDGSGRFLRTPVVEGKLKPGLAILIDSEHKFPIDRAQVMGLDPRKIIRQRASTLEQAAEHLGNILDKIREKPYFQAPDVPVVIVMDSLAAIPTEKEIQEKKLHAGGIAEKARVVRALMRRITSEIAKGNVTMIFVNHVYDRINVPGTESSGGRGVKFHASLRLDVNLASGPGESSKLMEGQKQVGIFTRIRAAKSSISAPSYETVVPILYESGVDDDLSTLEFLIRRMGEFSPPLLVQKGAWYSLQGVPDAPADGISFQYKTWREVLARPGLREYLWSRILQLIPLLKHK